MNLNCHEFIIIPIFNQILLVGWMGFSIVTFIMFVSQIYQKRMFKSEYILMIVVSGFITSGSIYYGSMKYRVDTKFFTS